MGPVWLIKLRGAKGKNLGLRVKFPGDPVVKNFPSNAGDMGSTAGQGAKNLCPAGQLNLHATTAELAHTTGEACALQQRRKAAKDFKQRVNLLGQGNLE